MSSGWPIKVISSTPLTTVSKLKLGYLLLSSGELGPQISHCLLFTLLILAGGDYFITGASRSGVCLEHVCSSAIVLYSKTRDFHQ